jgi:hypothetical protein
MLKCRISWFICQFLEILSNSPFLPLYTTRFYGSFTHITFPEFCHSGKSEKVTKNKTTKERKKIFLWSTECHHFSGQNEIELEIFFTPIFFFLFVTAFVVDSSS